MRRRTRCLPRDLTGSFRLEPATILAAIVESFSTPESGDGAGAACGGGSGRGARTGAGAKCVRPVRVWLLAPVRERMGGECPCPSTRTPWAASRTASTVTWWLLPDVLVRVIAPFTTIPPAWLWVHSLLPRGSADLQRIAVCSTPSSGRTPSPLRSRGTAHNTHSKGILPPGERRVLHSLRRAC